MEGAAVDVLDSPEAGGAAIRGGVLRLAGYAGGMALALAVAPLLIRHLGVVDFGRYTLVISLIAMVQGLTEGGLAAVGLREYTVFDPAHRRRLMQELLGLRIVLTFAGVALAVVFGLVAGYDGELIAGTVVAGVGLLLLVLFNLLTIPLQADLRFGWITVAEVLRQAIAAVLIVALVIAGAGIVPFIATQIPAGIVALAIAAVLVRKAISLRPAFQPGAWWTLVRETLPYAIAIAIAALYFRIVIVLMSLVSTETQTGYFATSYRVIEVLVAIPALLVSATFPVMSRAARDDADRLLYAGQRTFDAMLIVGVWLTLCVALGADFMIQVIGGEDFEASVDVLRIQSLAVMCTFVTVTCGFLLLSLRRHTAILASSVVPLTFGVILTLAIAPSEGAEGAAIATVVAEAGFAAAVLAFVKRRSVAHVPLSLRVFLPVGAAAALAASVELLIPDVHEVITVGLATAIYFAVLTALRQIPPELRGALAPGRERDG
ncbi:MAG TPA: oligosaccharide flippase family protein [Solirubrobacterales bacterium]|nr:oligosaccharide flippase family protein [Solirubrobacterales bacterium]